jgi:hypothetical protein
MRAVLGWTLGGLFVFALVAAAQTIETADDEDVRDFVVTDDCDPRDPAWAPVGCAAINPSTGKPRRNGRVTVAEFNAALFLGHPAWRIRPPYVRNLQDDSIEVRNTGGRPHSFTKVETFGGGVVAGLNYPGAVVAAECAAGFVRLDPNDTQKVEGLGSGTHNFQCCFHPWMRTTVKIR